MPARSEGPSLRRRAASAALAIAINLLLIIALLTLSGPAFERPQFKGGPIMLDLRPDAEPAPVVEATKAAAKPRPEPKRPTPRPPFPRVEPPPIPNDKPLPFVVLTREEFAASDIAKLGTRGAPAGGGEQVALAAADSKQVGNAPNGEPLYQAEWYRRPTRAELSGYLPARMPPEGWGLVACRTVARYRVEDCVELGDSPPGSRLASAVRQAAWQFLVRPPRIGGKELVGTWVRIRIEYSSAVAE